MTKGSHRSSQGGEKRTGLASGALRSPLRQRNSPPYQKTLIKNLRAYSAYDLISVEALVRYFHAAAVFKFRTTWLKAIKVGNYRTWPRLNLANATAYCPSEDETIKGHIVQSRQGF